ncbi:MAG: hypothetical protein LBP92_12475 [Deltaproteobacteria bacterium]|jgi:hypothetical protein|nr:hypothetical protein [Deltaproteobacteria bacterium]
MEKKDTVKRTGVTTLKSNPKLKISVGIRKKYTDEEITEIFQENYISGSSYSVNTASEFRDWIKKLCN